LMNALSFLAFLVIPIQEPIRLLDLRMAANYESANESDQSYAESRFFSGYDTPEHGAV
jgi:hypothetical protein